MSSKDRITKDSELKDVLKHPKAREVFDHRGFKCPQCGGFASEKLLHAAQCHGLDIEELIKEIFDDWPDRK